jgi:ABC transporter substrate binding protein
LGYSLPTSLWGPLRLGLRNLGFVEGQSIAFEERSSQGRDERFPDLASGLVRLKVNVIVTWGTPATLAAKQATKTIPIVMASAGDPVRSGLVTSLAHPGGNVTGLTVLGPGLAIDSSGRHSENSAMSRVGISATSIHSAHGNADLGGRVWKLKRFA